jgi:hypothetical protein
VPLCPKDGPWLDGGLRAGARGLGNHAAGPSCSIASHPFFAFFFLRGGHEVSPHGVEYRSASRRRITPGNSRLHCFGPPPPALRCTSAVRCGAVRGLWLSSWGSCDTMDRGDGVFFCVRSCCVGTVVYTPAEPVTYEELCLMACTWVMMSLSALRGTRHPRNSIQTILGLS